MSEPEAGIHVMPMQEYIMLRGLSSGTAHRLLSQSPAHARYSKHEESAAMDFGSLAHKVLLEDTEEGLLIVEADDWRTKAAKELRDNARERGKIPVLAKQMPTVRAMVKVAREFIAQSEIPDAFKNGAPELTIAWQDGETWCKARPDWLNLTDGIMLHYKTTQGSAKPEVFIRNQFVPMGYDLAAAFYERGLSAVGKTAMTVFLVQEVYEPFACSLVGLSPAMADIADSKVSRALTIWQECKKTGVWPAYLPRIHYAEPMPWHLAESEEKRTESEVDQWLGGQA